MICVSPYDRRQVPKVDSAGMEGAWNREDTYAEVAPGCSIARSFRTGDAVLLVSNDPSTAIKFPSEREDMCGSLE